MERGQQFRAGAMLVQPSDFVTESLSGIDAEVFQRRLPDLQSLEERLKVQITAQPGLRGCTVSLSGPAASVAAALPFVEQALLGLNIFPARAPPGFSPPVVASQLPEELGDGPIDFEELVFDEEFPGPPPGLFGGLAALEAPLPEAGVVESQEPEVVPGSGEATPETAAEPTEPAESAEASEAASKRKKKNKAERKKAQAARAEEEAAALELGELEVERARLTLKLPAPDSLNGVKSRKRDVMKLEGAGVSFNGGRPVVADVCMNVPLCSRTVVYGGKGAGKTTFARLLAGLQQPSKGSVARMMELKAAYFGAASVAELAQCTQTPAAYMAGRFGKAGAEAASLYAVQLVEFGLTAEVAKTPLEQLPSCQQALVALAVATWSKPQILVMDEPCELFSPLATHEFLKAFEDWRGGVVICSAAKHKSELDAFASERWCLRGGQLCLEYSSERPKPGLKAAGNGEASKAPAGRHDFMKAILDVEKRLREGVANGTLAEKERHELGEQMLALQRELRGDATPDRAR